MTSKSRACALAALLATAMVLAGCGDGGDADAKVERKSDGTVVLSDPTGDLSAQVDPDGDGITITNKDGRTTVGKGLPDGFPTKDIPLIDAEVVGSTKGDVGGPYAYTVLLQVKGASPTAVMEDVTAKLEAVGYTVTPGVAVDAMSTGVFSSPKYKVGVNAVESDGAVTVTYVVQNA